MEVLKLAHDSVFAGHLGITATKKILNEQIHMARRHKRHCELRKILRNLPKNTPKGSQNYLWEKWKWSKHHLKSSN